MIYSRRDREYQNSKSSYQKHHSDREREHRSKDDWYKSDHSEERAREYSSSPDVCIMYIYTVVIN